MRSAIVAEAPVSGKEVAQLARLETVIAQAERGFWDIGKGLQEIHERRLYRPMTWEKYCLTRWDRPHDWADEHIRAAGVMENLHARKSAGKFRDLAMPRNISQALALATLDDDQQWEVWHDLHERKEVPTIAKLFKAVEKLTGKPPDAESGEISEDVADELPFLPPGKRFDVVHGAEEEEDDEAAPAGRSRGKPDDPLAVLRKKLGVLMDCIDQIKDDRDWWHKWLQKGLAKLGVEE